MINEEKPTAFQNNNKFKDIPKEYPPQSFVIHYSSLIKSGSATLLLNK
jgi:hypothetical protein